METVTVSSKYQVVIPRKIREALQIKPGEKIQVLQFDDRIEFVPFKKIKEMRGFLKGMDTNFVRDKE